MGNFAVLIFVCCSAAALAWEEPLLKGAKACATMSCFTFGLAELLFFMVSCRVKN